MAIKLQILAFALIGFISPCMAYTKIFKHNEVTIEESAGSKHGYKISIYQLPKKSSTNENFLDSAYLSSITQDNNKPIWGFTTTQLPITDDDCYEAHEYPCDDEYTSCYNHCLTGLQPEVIEFDERSKKLYFLVGTISIGTGGGPALLFMADVNKKEIKLVHAEWHHDLGSLSPSGRYLVIHGNSTLISYDTRNFNRSELNKNENSYDENNNIRHGLYVKKWLNDKQFIYLDIARYFVRPIPEGGEPFYSAKEVLYDLANRKILSEHKITKDEADAYEKLYN